jgi:hypothetical protein
VRNGFSQKGEPVKPVRTSQIKVDFLLENHGSIFLLKPQTPIATSWLEEHVGQDNGYQPYWPTCLVEHRYIADIVAGIQNDGLVCL